MRVVLPISKKRYLYELRQQMGSFTDFWSERFTGIILGNFIYVTHHAGHEWNRKITNEASRAFGFVTKHEGGCKVNVILTRGCLDPFWLTLYYLVGLLLLMATEGGRLTNVHIWALAFSLFTGIYSYVVCWFTERGQYSMRELKGLLNDPVRFWAEVD